MVAAKVRDARSHFYVGLHQLWSWGAPVPGTAWGRSFKTLVFILLKF